MVNESVILLLLVHDNGRSGGGRIEIIITILIYNSAQFGMRGTALYTFTLSLCRFVRVL